MKLHVRWARVRTARELVWEDAGGDAQGLRGRVDKVAQQFE